MKKIIILFLPLLVNCKNEETNLSQIDPNSKSITEIKDSLFKKITNDTLSFKLTNKTSLQKKSEKDSVQKIYFQNRIDSVLTTSFKLKNNSSIENIQNEIETIKDISKNNKNYWNSFLYYQSSILFNQNGDSEKSKELINKAMSLLEDSKTSEDFALLAACKSFSTQFANMMTVANISQEVQDNAKMALQLNPKNLRAYYVLCSNNFYTPKMFGGMSKVENYALKGLDCPFTIDNENYYAPRWGKNFLYDFLIQYLEIKKTKKNELEKYKQLFKSEFPNDSKN